MWIVCDVFIGKYSNIVFLMIYINMEEYVIRDWLKFSENLLWLIWVWRCGFLEIYLKILIKYI